jgi:hypothetical protein
MVLFSDYSSFFGKRHQERKKKKKIRQDGKTFR